MSVSTYWLIERIGGYGGQASFWCATGAADHFTPDTQQATRFARKQDGESVRSFLLISHKDCAVTEHMDADKWGDAEPFAPGEADGITEFHRGVNPDGNH